MVAQFETDQNPTIPEEKIEQFHDQDPYEAEETLSLCDLPTHGDSAHWDDFSKDYQSSSFDNEDEEDNFFEFFSEDFTASTYPSGKDIIFCGKLIPYNKEAPNFAAEKKTPSQEIDNGKIKRSGSTKKGIFRSWRSYSFHKVKSLNSKVQDQRSNINISTSLSFPTSKSYRKCEISKVSILSSAPSKSKWYLFLFGMTRFPTEMELRDIRTRQSRRSPSTMFRTSDEESDQMGLKGKKGNKRNGAKGLWGLWGLLRTVGCSSNHPNAVVKAGFL